MYCFYNENILRYIKLHVKLFLHSFLYNFTLMFNISIPMDHAHGLCQKL